MYNCNLRRVPCASIVVIFGYAAIATKKIAPATYSTNKPITFPSTRYF